MSAAPQVGMLFFNCNKRFLPALNLKLLHRQTQSIMRLAHLQKFDLSVDFVGNRAMQILNRKHRGKDVPTDVLSFPAFQVRRQACSCRLCQPALFSRSFCLILCVSDQSWALATRSHRGDRRELGHG